MGKCFLRPYLAGETGKGFEDKGLVERGREEGAAGSGTERGTGIGAGERMTDTIRRKLKNLGLYIYRIKRDINIGMLGFVASGLELAVDGNVGILVETGIGLEAGFGLGTAFNDREIMVKEPDSPFEGFGRMSVLKSMGLALGLFDEFAVGYAGC